MALSDEVVAGAKGLATVRERVERLVDRTGAAAGFLVDEEGNPFATVGHVEFPFPHPLAGLLGQGGSPLLGALLGEPAPEESGLVVERAGARALVVLVHSAPSDATRALVREEARRLAALLDSSTPEQ